MSETAIVGENVEVIQTSEAGSAAFSWSAAIAGAIAAVAVTFIFVALGSGIGLSLSSPYRDTPSLAGLSIAAAVWLVMAQGFGFAAGGYLAARLRRRMHDSLADETTFRDGAQGFLVWAIAVVANLLVAATAAGLLGATWGAGAAVGAGAALGGQQGRTPDRTAYFVDALLRPAPGLGQVAGRPSATTGQAAGSGTGTPAPADAPRAEIARILAVSIAQRRLSDEDRGYLAQVVAQRTGLSPDEANRRVQEVAQQVRQTVVEAGDKASKIGAYASFWAFMSLLFGAVAATLGGILGGELRDRPGPGPLARGGLA